MSNQSIAVVGLGCVLPDARSPDQLWQNLTAGRCSVKTLAGGSWDWARYLDASGADLDRATSILGARVDGFEPDWRQWRIPPADARVVNPLQFMVLDAGIQALGGVKNVPKERTGLFIGSTGLGWQRDTGLRLHLERAVDAIQASPAFAALDAKKRARIIADMKRTLDERLLPVSEDNVVGAAASVAAGRIAMHFDLRGLHYAVDAGFASGLASVDVGVRALRDGTVDMAVVGGASELLTPLELVAFSRLGGLAKTRVAPFDAGAEGTLLGEGTVIFALKRLDDALRDGEQIRAVIAGIGGSSDGKGRSVVAPRTEGQAIAMRRAYEDAGIEPSAVSYVECHATGTQVGDASEVRALASVYGEGKKKNAIALGSAKAFVGHLRAAAGAVGLLRAVLALEHRQVPRQIGVDVVNPALEIERTPFFVPHDAPVELAADARAAVSAFGFGGNNFHAVVTSAESSTTRPRRTPVKHGGDIAICAMGGRFPIGDDVPAFWQALLDKKDATREVPKDRWDIDRHYDPDPARLDTSYTRIGCFLDALPAPTPSMGIPPSAAESLDPSQVLAILAAEEALAHVDASKWNPDRVGVYLAFLPYQGKKFRADLRVNFAEVAADLSAALSSSGVPESTARAIVDEGAQRFREGLPRITEDTLTGFLGSMVAARVTRILDAHGPHFVVDSACASTHAAVHAAMTALRHGVVDAALTGGVWCDMMPEFFVAACRFNALSATGSTPFDARADGFIPGEGAGVFVLRRLEDAEKNGEPIIAIVRAVAGSSDGRGRSLLAPKPEGEADAMTRALATGSVPADSVDYVECHGTGTALGDAVEVEALTKAYGTGRARPLMIGSVKSNIGHLNAAAGVPALIKAALAVREGVIPASLKLETPNPAIDFASGPIEVVTETRAWRTASGAPRRAGVSGFGVGGSNMHLVVEEYRPANPGAAKSSAAKSNAANESGANQSAAKSSTAKSGAPNESGANQSAASPSTAPRSPAGSIAPRSMALDTVVAASPHAARSTTGDAVTASSQAVVDLPIALAAGADLATCAAQLRALLDRRDDFARARTATHGESGGPVRVAIVAHDANDLQKRMRALDLFVARVKGLAGVEVLRAQGIFAGRVDVDNGKVAVMFPGQGTQYANMARAVSARFPAVAATLGDADRAYERLCGRTLTREFFTTDEAKWTQHDEDIHCAVFAVGLGLFRQLESFGFAPDAVMGQSAGELAALVANRSLSFEDGLFALRARTLAVLGVDVADRGRMLSLRCGAARARDLMTGIDGVVVVAAENCPSACLVSGDTPATDALLAVCATEGVDAIELAVSHAYHSPIIASAQAPYRAQLATLAFHAGRAPLYSTISGDAYDGAMPEHLASQFVKPVLLETAFAAMHRDGVRIFVECGPRWPLTTFADESLGALPHTALATMHPKVGEVEQLCRALAGLWCVNRCTLAKTPEKPAAVVGALAQALHTVADAPDSPALRRLLLSVRDAVDVYLSTPPSSSSQPPNEVEAATTSVTGSNPRADVAPERAPTPRTAATHAHAAATHASAAPASAAAPVPTASTGPAPASSPPPTPRSGPRTIEPATSSAAGSRGDDKVRLVLVAKAVARTGYPAEMLELDLDLEADLGIDTVKQVAIIAETKQELGLARDPAFKLRDHNTLRKVIAYLESKLAPNDVSAASDVERKLVAKAIARTGYPAEMLELDLDLEADLGIDTVKQVAIIAETKQELGLPRDPAFKLREHNTLRKIAAYLVGKLGGPAAVPVAAPELAAFESVRAVVVKHAMSKTGYPADMFEPDVDLERDLGIDTVRQVAILSDIRAHFGLNRDVAFSLRDAVTVRKIVTYVMSRLASAQTAPRGLQRTLTPVAMPAARAPDVAVAAAVAPEMAPIVADDDRFENVASPVEVADRRAGRGVIVPNEARLLELLIDGARRSGAIGRLAMLAQVELGAEGTGPVTLAAHRADERVRIRGDRADGVVLVTGAAHLTAKPPGTSASSSRETEAAMRAFGDDGGAAAPVRALSAGFGDAVDVTAVVGLAFDELVGRARLRVEHTAGTDAATIAGLLTAAFALASAGATSTTGRIYRLAGIERVRFERPAHGGEEIAIHIRLGTSRRAPLAALAEVVDARGTLVARIDGLLLADVAGVEQDLWRRLRAALRRTP